MNYQMLNIGLRLSIFLFSFAKAEIFNAQLFQPIYGMGEDSSFFFRIKQEEGKILLDCICKKIIQFSTTASNEKSDIDQFFMQQIQNAPYLEHDQDTSKKQKIELLNQQLMQISTIGIREDLEKELKIATENSESPSSLYETLIWIMLCVLKEASYNPSQINQHDENAESRYKLWMQILNLDFNKKSQNEPFMAAMKACQLPDPAELLKKIHLYLFAMMTTPPANTKQTIYEKIANEFNKLIHRTISQDDTQNQTNEILEWQNKQWKDQWANQAKNGPTFSVFDEKKYTSENASITLPCISESNLQWAENMVHDNFLQLSIFNSQETIKEWMKNANLSDRLKNDKKFTNQLIGKILPVVKKEN